MKHTKLASNLSVGAQIFPSELETLARDGFTDIVCNRPDAEHSEAAGSTIMAKTAAGLGMAFHYLPIGHGDNFEAQARALAGLARNPGAKILAYCRSGARSANAWSLAQDMRFHSEQLTS